jgi:hypothetical protein
VAPSLLAIAPATARLPTGPAYDLVLLAHVIAVLIGVLAVAVSGVQSARLLGVRPDEEVPETLRRYYRPGVNWAGRVLWAVPPLGFALLGMSHGAYGPDDGWVLAGLAVWAVATGGAEGLLWPAERRIQASLAVDAPGAPVRPPGPLRRYCRVLCATAAVVLALLVAGCVLMVAKP